MLMSIVGLMTKKLRIRTHCDSFFSETCGLFFPTRPSDSLMSETSTVDRENGTDRDTALVPNLGDDNVNSSLSIEQRTKEWLLSIEDIKKIK